MDDVADRIAREAARLIHTGQIDEIDRAIAAAADRVGLAGSRSPGAGRVRQHLQGMSMQAMGDAAYAERRREILSTIEELMTLVETTFDDAEMLLVGRAAQGLFDGPGAVHIRLYTDHPIRDVAALLADHEYDEPQLETAKTRLGRLDRLRVVEAEVEMIVTRCPAVRRSSAGRDLFDDTPIATLDLNGLRVMLER